MSKEFKIGQHPVLANIVIIALVAIIGLVILFLWLNIFTRHGEWETVPEVENMSFTNAIHTLHDKGFRTDIRDSVYKDEITPGFVVEQFPKAGSKVKPGRKVFLYINAVHPRELIIDADNSVAGEALKGYSLRQGLAKLEELGFRKVNVVKVPGDNDRIIRLLANGKTVAKMEKVPVTAMITVEVHDGQLNRVTDSLLEEEYLQYVTEVEEDGSEAPNAAPIEDEIIDIEPAFVQ
ncbi:MAG: PASTA domain-containing protein [Muribaculaceae bacterium]|nr:PASTA domain-containing protein [Muribaculaceae bacterium]